MPFDFAERLFGVTRLGLRVIVAPNDVAPAEIAHPVLFLSKPGAGALATARATEADEAAKKADQARLAAGAAYRAVTRAMMPVRVAENLKLKAEKELLVAETALATAASAEAAEQAEGAKVRTVAKIAELQERWAAAKADLQPKLDALTAAREAVTTAETARARAAEVAREAARALEPVSILISRKTQRLYVRQGFEAIFDSPVTILDPDRPIGTHVFTAMERTSGDASIRWNVVSLRGEGLDDDLIAPRGLLLRGNGRDLEPVPTEPTKVKTALDRIVIPEDVLDRIPGMVPRSSLIITDEALSTETGKGTDFVVLLSGEPQGGIKFRRRGPATEFPFARSRNFPAYWRRPFAGPFSTW